MSVDVLTEITIDRPVEIVAAYATDPGNTPAWYDNIYSVEWKTPPPNQLGSRLAFVARFLGRRLAYTYELIELVANARLVMRTAQGKPSGFSKVAPLGIDGQRRCRRLGWTQCRQPVG